jgi:hypothetical protein
MLRIGAHVAVVFFTAFLLVPSAFTNQERTGKPGRSKTDRKKGVVEQEATIAPTAILRGETPKPVSIPQTTTPAAPAEKNPPKKEAEKPEQKRQDQPAQSQQQAPVDYSDDFFEKNIGNFYYGVGNCKCDGLSSLKDTAVADTLKYIETNKSCIEARSGGQIPENMAINDYRSSTGCMYIIDRTGHCVKAVDAAYGIGSNQHGGAPTPGCGAGSLATPSGFHITGRHNGGRYNESNSMLMQDLQGQGSAGRGILIHSGVCSGGACTWGCTGVSSNGQPSEETFQDVRRKIPYGSLVYNYFGEGPGRSCPGIDKFSCSGSVGSSGHGLTSGIRGSDRTKH